ncbi:MAG: cryptochrome/photolyase family protein [Betaproteobacteria bacterium]|nr:cryptochrome/photolyase family protein [Betaproteobacteria bacterium]
MGDLRLILGDQLWLQNPALDGVDPAHDQVLMIEAASEGAAVWSHKARITLFLSAMRHFAHALRDAGLPLEYVVLDAAEPPDFAARLRERLMRLRPRRVVCCEPGEWRMLALLQSTCAEAGVPLELRADTHFACTRHEFAAWAKEAPVAPWHSLHAPYDAPAPAPHAPASGPRRSLRMEYFYRHMRKKHDVLMQGDAPWGGQWNFDADNRRPYPKSGPGDIPAPARFAPDDITRDVMALVQRHFADHPASADWQAHFGWPVTRAQALQALQHFVQTRLMHFGPHQDAMWTDTPFGWHALLSPALNLHLIHPLEVVRAAQARLQAEAPADAAEALASVEGFIRQVLGWREFMRGVYWLDMPQLAEANHYGHGRALPAWYWTGDTGMRCMRDSVGQTLRHGYAHHIQRLMVTGNFALLAEVLPQHACDWYLAVYVDAVDWVERPNTAGMALNANGGRFTSKPYIASGQYIARQSNYCAGCRYDPTVKTGHKACPVSTLYWRFLDKHEPQLLANPRTTLMARHIGRWTAAERSALRQAAGHLLDHLDAA